MKAIAMFSILALGLIGAIATAHADLTLTQPECNHIGKQYVDMSLANYTFVCGYPFNATVPYGNVLIWIDSADHTNPKHTITSDNGTFNSDTTWFWQKALVGPIYQVDHTYYYHDQDSKIVGWINVVAQGQQAVVQANMPAEPTTPNNNTPLQLPPVSVGLPPSTPWKNPSNSTNSTATNSTSVVLDNSTSTKNSTTTVIQTVTSVSEIKKLNDKLDALQAKLDAMSTEQTSIFGMLTKLLHSFNLL